MAAPLRFQFSEQKGLEALIYIARQWPEVTAFYAAKVFFFAEKWHLNRYARPIAADTFVAMPNGPVPSTIYRYFRGELDMVGDPGAVTRAISITHDRWARATALRDPDLDILSATDVECLAEAIEFCRDKSVPELSRLTHAEDAWRKAPQNGAMNYERMIDADRLDAVLDEAREFAAYGVL